MPLGTVLGVPDPKLKICGPPWVQLGSWLNHWTPNVFPATKIRPGATKMVHVPWSKSMSFVSSWRRFPTKEKRLVKGEPGISPRFFRCSREIRSWMVQGICFICLCEKMGSLQFGRFMNSSCLGMAAMALGVTSWCFFHVVLAVLKVVSFLTTQFLWVDTGPSLAGRSLPQVCGNEVCPLGCHFSRFQDAGLSRAELS